MQSNRLTDRQNYRHHTGKTTGKTTGRIARHPGALAHLLTDLFTVGQVTRGEATAILNIPERTAREVIRSLVNYELIRSEGPGRPLRLAFPTLAFGFYFPRLYPDAIAADFIISKAAKALE